MKNYNICIKTALAVFAVALSACSSDDDIADNNSNSQEKPVTNKTMTFRATMDDGSGSNSKATRTDFNGNNTIWAANDKIYILNKADVDEEHPAGGEFIIGEPADGSNYGKEEKFSGDKIKANGNNNDQFYAFYPAQTLTNTSGAITASGNIPTVQTATDGTYDQTLHYMSAYSTNSTFNFKNVCALLKITLTGNDSDNTNPVCRVKVVANPTLSAMNAQEFTYTNIAGGFTATIGSNGEATTTATGTKNTYVELHAANDNTASTSLGNGTFYMVVLPAQLDNGFTLILEKKDGTIYQRINTSITAFVRNEMYKLGSYNCSGAPANMTELTDVVDLGLPSGTLWATKNISEGSREGNNKTTSFVSNTTDVGGYFAWGEIATKSGIYVWGNTSPNYKYGRGANVSGNNTFNPSIGQGYLSRYNSFTNYQTRWFNNNETTPPDYVEQLASEDDVAYLTDNNFCMPIYTQIKELLENTTITHNSSVFVLTSKTTGYTAKTVSLPAGGYKGDYTNPLLPLFSGYTYDESHACYWTRTRISDAAHSYQAYYYEIWEESHLLSSNTLEYTSDGDFRSEGRLIRPVVLNEAFAPVKTYQQLCEEAAEAQNNQ